MQYLRPLVSYDETLEREERTWTRWLPALTMLTACCRSRRLGTPWSSTPCRTRDGSPSEFVELISHGNRMRYPVMFLLRRVQGNPLDLRLVAKFRVDDNGAPLVLLELGERVTGLMRDGVEWKVGE